MMWTQNCYCEACLSGDQVVTLRPGNTARVRWESYIEHAKENMKALRSSTIQMYYRKHTGFKARNDDKSQIILSNIDLEVERGIREEACTGRHTYFIGYCTKCTHNLL